MTVAKSNPYAQALAEIRELRGDLQVARLQLARITEEVRDPNAKPRQLQIAIMNIRYILEPTKTP